MTSLFCNQGLSENKRPVGPALLHHIMHATERWGSLQRNPRKVSPITKDSIHNLTFYFAGMRNHFTQQYRTSTESLTCLKFYRFVFQQHKRRLCLINSHQHHGIVNHMTLLFYSQHVGQHITKYTVTNMLGKPTIHEASSGNTNTVR